jgi:FtsP/CotA-like multicopper oxidase with cupredoxin domain/sugar lactone lactonase YvrE
LRTYHHNIISAAAVLGAGLFVSPANAARPFPKVTNVSPNPAGTNEFYLTATNMTVTNIGGTNVQVRVFMDDPPGGGGAPAGLPCPMVEIGVGMMVICHFQNNLTNNIEGASIHWHGIELNNNSDGTGVTQDSILPGQGYVYRFIAPRAGLFWYHSHMIPGSSTFGGMYGPLLVTNSAEDATLMAANILPSTNYTFPLVLSDISFSNGVVGKVVTGTNYPLNTLIQFCENFSLGTSSADTTFCGPAGIPGNIALVNGYPPILAGSFGAPTTSSAPLYTVANNSRVRLQLFDASISRDFYMSLRYPNGAVVGDTNLYRIGGQGGYLDNAIIDGGMQGTYDFLYNSGSIVIGTGMRADVMFYPSGTNGTIIELVGNPLPAPWNLSGTTAPGDGDTNLPPNYPLAFFVITNTGVTNVPLANGSPIVAGTIYTNISLKTMNTNALIPPPTPSQGVTPGGTITIPSGLIVPSGSIVLENDAPTNAATNVYTPRGPTIDGYAAIPLDGNAGDGSVTSVPHPPSAIWARVGDVLQLAIINDVGGGLAMHPYHLHGFSMQPMYIYSANLQTNLYTFNYNEYLDEIEVYPGEAIIFRIHLTDRPDFANTGIGGPVPLGGNSSTGGAVGRWLMHCHIFLHGTIGMISELVVVANTLNRLEGPAAGSDSAVLANSPGSAWTATTNATWLHLSAANQSGTGNTNVIFTYDANPGATRTGTLTVAGETVNVTQAGLGYVQAPGPVTGVVTNGLSDPVDVAVDASGDVYFSDGRNNAIKKWTAANNTVSTLVPGLSNPQGVAIDSLGNVYFADFGNSAIKKWTAASDTVSTVISGISDPIGVAVDVGGNLYIAVPGDNAIEKWTAATTTLSTLTTAGLSAPYGVAVDAAGNVYIADTGHSAIREWIAANGDSVPLVTSGLDNPWDLAVDGAGNVYIADGYDDDIKMWSAASNTLTTLATGLGDPTGVAVDGSQNVYIADFNNNAIRELPYAFVNPAPITETAAISSGNLPVVVPATANLLAPFVPTVNQSWLSISGVTDGVVGFDVGVNLNTTRTGDIIVLGEDIPVTQEAPSYTLGTSTLLVGPAAGTNSVVLKVIPSIALWGAAANATWLHLPYVSGTGSGDVVFTFDANPGATRTGTLTISGQTLTVTQAGSTYVQAPGPLTGLVTNGLFRPVEVAVDGSGNVYISDSGNETISKWKLGNNSVTTLVSNTQVSLPQGVAVDTAGNVYFADLGNSVVKEWLVANSNIITLVSNNDLLYPEGVALDDSGNVYISDNGLDEVLEWTAANSNVVTLISSGLTSPYGLTVDAAGNIYIADTYAGSSGEIEEWTAASATLSVLVPSGLNSPWNVAVDGSGNVYIADGNDGAIKKWTAANGNLTTLVSGLSTPTDVAVDGSDNVYIANYGAAAVEELPYAFVNPTAKTEGKAAGSDVLPTVLFPAENLLAPFVPTVNEPWLSIGSVASGVVTFDFAANNTTASRTGDITLLGETIPVTQAGVVPPPILINAKMLTNGVFQFGFTNANLSASFTVLFTTNLTVPLADWIAIGMASNLSPGVLQFADTNASNTTRFYMIKSP